MRLALLLLLLLMSLLIFFFAVSHFENLLLLFFGVKRLPIFAGAAGKQTTREQCTRTVERESRAIRRILYRCERAPSRMCCSAVGVYNEKRHN